jgi:hypothetical protein
MLAHSIKNFHSIDDITCSAWPKNVFIDLVVIFRSKRMLTLCLAGVVLLMGAVVWILT